MNARLLPSRLGPWTKAATFTFDTSGRISYAVAKIKTIGVSDFPDDWLPWLVFEFGLEAVVPYVRTLKQALLEGRIWQKRRGTESGIEIGIGWVESKGVVAAPDGRHDWWKFQVGFDDPPDDLQQMRQLDGIIRLSKAAEDELFRMFSPDYDHRPVRMDQHRADAGGWFDGYSGAPRWDGGPLISFGRTGTTVSDLAPLSGTGLVFEGLSAADRLGDGVRYDENRFGVRPSSVCEAAGEIDMRSAASVQIEPAVAVGRYFIDTADVASSYSDDTWPDVYTAGARWQDTTGGFSIPLSPEAS